MHWGSMLAFGLDSGRLMVVDEATGEEKWAVQAHALTSSVHVAMPQSGRIVASVGFQDDACKIWDAGSGELQRVLAMHEGTGAHIGAFRQVAFSPCGQRLATPGSDGAVILWDARTGEAEHRMQGVAGHSRGMTSITFSADGARVASVTGEVVTRDESIDVFDTTTGAWLRTIGGEGRLTGVSFSPIANSILASVTMDDAIHMWDIDSGEMIREIEGCNFAIFSPDGRTIATASPGHDVEDRGDMQLMDAESGQMRLRIVGHSDVVWTASWSADGSKLATVSVDDTCKVWDSTTGALLRTIENGHATGRFSSMAWGRDWVNPTPHTLHPKPYTLHPTPYTVNPQPSTRNLKLGAGHATGGGVRDGAPPAARGGVAGA